MNFTKHKQVKSFLPSTALLCTLLLLIFLASSPHNVNSAQDAETSAPTAPADPALLSHIQTLMTPTQNCNLPCFWGFQSENATLADIQQFVKTNLSDIKLSEDTYPDQEYSTDQFKISNYDVSIPIYGFAYNALEDGGVRVRFATHDNTLVYTFVEIFQPRPEWLPSSMFNLSDVLKTFGQPTDMRVRIQGPYPPTFIWTLYYAEKGVILQYEFDFNTPWGQMGGDDPIMMCSLPEHAIAIRVWLQHGTISGSVKDHLAPTASDWSLKKMAGMDLAQFTKTFLADPSSCLTIVSQNALLKEQYPFQ